MNRCRDCVYIRQIEEDDRYGDFIEQNDIIGKCYKYYQNKMRHYIERINSSMDCTQFNLAGDNNELKEEE